MTIKRTGFAFLMCLAAVSCVAVGGGGADKGDTTILPEHLQPSGWELVWRDAFSGNRLDRTKWTLCKRGKPDWKDTMSDDPRLLRIEDGVLHLRGILNDKKDDKDPAPYLTAGVSSRGKFAFRYGKVQIRARFKSAQGAWPALWMMGSEPGWPVKGEKQWPCNQPFYLLLSMQIGGKWVNRSGPTNPAHYPADMKVDWVRVYRRKKPADQAFNKPDAGDSRLGSRSSSL